MHDDIINLVVKPIQNCGSLRALASFNFKGVVLKGLKLMESNQQFWLAMPSRKSGEKWEDIFFISDQGLKQRILKEIICKYTVSPDI